MSRHEVIKQAVREYILEEFLPGEPADSISDDTELAAEGILSSIDTLKLITHLEDTYHISIDTHEVVNGPLKSVETIATLVVEKQSEQ
jgi:acyl carrier protein